MDGARVRPVGGYEELVAASGSDAFVRWCVPPDRPVQGWRFPGGVAFLRVRPTRRTGPTRRTSLTVRATPQDAAAALPALLEQAPGTTWVTLPRGALDRLPDHLTAEGHDWEWMRTTAVPTWQPRQDDVLRLGTVHQDEVSELLDVASPRHSAPVGDTDVRTWYGIRDPAGPLVACTAHAEQVPGVPHLASIATHPAARGQGLGAAITAAATTAALRSGAPVVTLGMYSDNAVARRMYARLGYVCEHRWSSRRLVR